MNFLEQYLSLGPLRLVWIQELELPLLVSLEHLHLLADAHQVLLDLQILIVYFLELLLALSLRSLFLRQILYFVPSAEFLVNHCLLADAVHLGPIDLLPIEPGLAVLEHLGAEPLHFVYHGVLAHLLL